MTDVFISYSRKDIAFARLLHQALLDNGLDTWIDWQDIPPSADWLAEVYEAIEGADAFVFVISETSLASEICGLEMAHAAAHNKRLIPIVIKDVDAGQVPKELAVLNWIFFEEAGEKFEKAMADLVTAITVDQGWVKGHTRFENRALDWERKGRDRGTLLRGADLSEAEAWLGGSAGKDPGPTALQTEYILKSREDATRRQRQTLIGVGAALVVAVGLGILAWTQRNIAVEQRDIAEEQRKQAEARGLAASSLSLVKEDLDLALLLGMESIQREVNYFTQNAFLSALQYPLSLLRYIQAGTDATSAVAYHPEGALLISAGKDGSIRFWDPVDNLQVGDPLQGHTEEINDLEISPDGSILASASDDGTVCLWNLAEMSLLATLHSYNDQVATAEVVSFSSEGAFLLVGYNRGITGIWDLASYQNLGYLEREYGDVGHVFVHPDGKYWITNLYLGFVSQSIDFRDMATGQRYKDSIDLSDTVESITAMAISQDGRQLVFSTSTDVSNFLYLWGLEDDQEIKKISHENGYITSLVYSPDGMMIASGGDGLTLWEQDLSGNYLLDEYSARITDLAYRPDGNVIVGSLDDGTIRVYKLYSRVQDTLPFREHAGEGYGVSLAVAPGGGLLASTSGSLEEKGDTRIELWDLANMSLLGFLDIEAPLAEEMIVSIDFSPKGDILAAGTSKDRIFVWDTSTREPLASPLSEDSGGVVRFSADGGTFISGSSTVFRVWEVDNSTRPPQIKDSGYRVYENDGYLDSLLYLLPQGEGCPFAIHPDGSQIALKGPENTIKLLDLETFEEVGNPLEGAPSQVMDFAFSSDGSMLAAGGYDGSILIWDTSTQDRIGQIMTGHVDQIVKLIFSNDGRVLYSASDDGTIRLWDVATQRQIGEPISDNAKSLAVAIPGFDPLLPLSGFSGSRIMDMALTPDGSMLVASNASKNLWPLDLSLSSWTESACLMAGRNLTQEEWDLYLGVLPYHETCSGFSAATELP